jgi:hypothetical protein
MDNIPDCQYDYRYERPQATIVHRCCMCGGDIFHGDEYYDIDGKIICADCISECRH